MSFKGRGNVNAFLKSSKTRVEPTQHVLFCLPFSSLIEFGAKGLPLYEKEFKIRFEGIVKKNK